MTSRHFPTVLPLLLLLPCLLVLVVVSSLPSPVSGRFYYTSFRDVRFLSLVGSATPHIHSDPACVALTGGDDEHAREGNQTGAVWYDRRIEMREKKKRLPGQGPDGFGQSSHIACGSLWQQSHSLVCTISYLLVCFLRLVSFALLPPS